MNDDDRDTLIAQLTSDGLIEPVFHDDGSVGCRIVPDEESPLWQLHLKGVAEDIKYLLEEGFIEIAGVDEHGEIMYRPTELGRNYVEG